MQRIPASHTISNNVGFRHIVVTSLLSWLSDTSRNRLISDSVPKWRASEHQQKHQILHTDQFTTQIVMLARIYIRPGPYNHTLVYTCPFFGILVGGHGIAAGKKHLGFFAV